MGETCSSKTTDSLRPKMEYMHYLIRICSSEFGYLHHIRYPDAIMMVRPRFFNAVMLVNALAGCGGMLPNSTSTLARALAGLLECNVGVVNPPQPHNLPSTSFYKALY